MVLKTQRKAAVLPEVAIVPEGEFTRVVATWWCSVLFHNLPAWNRLNVSAQEKVVGHAKPDSIELDDVPSSFSRQYVWISKKKVRVLKSFVTACLTAQQRVITATDIAYCNVRHNFDAMLEACGGVTIGKTDQHNYALLKAVTGAYYFAPSTGCWVPLTIK